MSLENLNIAGSGLSLKPKFPLKFVTRTVYNPKYFFDDSFKHEIANHYRDFKQRPAEHRRRRNIFAHLYNSVGSESIAKCRSELKPAAHYFPRFADVYKPRGRQTLCETKPPDQTYNDTIRRIRATQNCEALQKLVQRQLRSQQQANKSKTITTTTIDCKQNTHKERVHLALNDDYKAQRQHQQLQRRQRRSLGNLAVLITNNNNTTPQQKQQQHHTAGLHRHTSNAYNSDAKLTHYLKLASDYYEKGYLRNIRYLVSIGEQNALALNKTAARESLECQVLTKLVRQIGRKRSFKIDINAVKSFNTDDIESDCAIRVNIKPATTQATKPYRSIASAECCLQTGVREEVCSMNDYLNANSSQAFNYAIANNNSTTHNSTLFQHQQQQLLQHESSTHQNKHFQDLIQNLTQLELNDSNHLLPKITLTDCSTINTQTTTTTTATDYIDIATDNASSSRSARRFMLKETKFCFNNSSLEIPSESNFFSDARPP